MADSARTSDDYALSAGAATTAAAVAGKAPELTQTRRHCRRQFRPRLWPTLATAVLVPLFICAGQWQWHKAANKADRQQELAARSAQPAITMPTTLAAAETLRDRRVVARGSYEAEQQMLIDNRTLHGQAGYHVITPLRIEGSALRVLVNRGWIPALAEHRQIPEFATPTGIVEISGIAVVPSTRFFTLAAESATANPGGQRVWQNLDLKAYARAVSFPMQPIVIELDARSAAGGFAREWQVVDDGRASNLSYAFQWWAFAATAVVLWVVLNFRRPSGP